jgi:hypothetical protein
MICPCGAVLISKQECLENDDEILRHVGEAYLDDEFGYCIEEDDVVPFAWAYETETDRHRQMRMQKQSHDENPFAF